MRASVSVRALRACIGQLAFRARIACSSGTMSRGIAVHCAGSRVDGTGVVRSSNRDGTTPETALNLVGFRVARTP